MQRCVSEMDKSCIFPLPKKGDFEIIKNHRDMVVSA